jgi:hypothetical protein
MRLGRKKAQPRRQRQIAAEPTPQSSSYTYSSQRGEGRNEKVSRTKPLKQRLILAIILILGLFATVNMLSLSSQSKVLPMTKGQDQALLQETAVYERAANQLLNQSVWNRNKITFNSSNLSKEISRRFPELARVNVVVPIFSSRPIVYVEPYKPALVLTSVNDTFLISDTGTVLLKASSPSAIDQPSLPVVNDQSGLRVTPNKPVLSSDDIAFIRTVSAQLGAKGKKLDSLSLPPESRELHARLTGEGYLVKFNLMAGKAREQVGALLATQSELGKKGIKPGEYVDLRVIGKVYYK